ncbi:hypothetical protein NMG60_11032885 [Bertholletia excelsa]
MGSSVHFVMGVLGGTTFKRIIKNKSTEQFSCIPYLMALLNCLLFTWYGLPFVSPHNLLVSTISAVGAALESMYIVVFVIFAPKKEKGKILALVACLLTTFGLTAVVSLLAFHGKKRKLFCGLAATIFCIVMYASPLSVMRMVIKTKSVEYMPFLLSLFVFLNGTCWFIYGLLEEDPFITVANGFGSGFGAIQLILYAMYRERKGEPEKESRK